MPQRSIQTRDLVFRTEKRWRAQAFWKCVYCGRRQITTVDHFYPYASSKDHSPRNLVPACPKCNKSKSNLDPVEWMNAVGVRPGVRDALLRIYDNPDFKAPRGLQVPRVTLDYEPAKQLQRLARVVSGQKGK